MLQLWKEPQARQSQGATQLLMMKNARSKNVNTVQQGIGATTAAAATKNALAICGGSTMAVAIRYHDDDDNDDYIPTKARNNAVAATLVVTCRCCDVASWQYYY